MIARQPSSPFFFFNDTATTEIYTLSLHDALPICYADRRVDLNCRVRLDEQILAGFPIESDIGRAGKMRAYQSDQDRKSTGLNSSHLVISYAVFCLKKKKHPVHSHPIPRT